MNILKALSFGAAYPYFKPEIRWETEEAGDMSLSQGRPGPLAPIWIQFYEEQKIYGR